MKDINKVVLGHSAYDYTRVRKRGKYGYEGTPFLVPLYLFPAKVLKPVLGLTLIVAVSRFVCARPCNNRRRECRDTGIAVPTSPA